MGSSAPSAWVDFLYALQTGGPWTIVLGLAFAVRHLHIARDKDREVYDEQKQKLNDRLIGMAEKQNDVLERATANQSLLLEAVQMAQRPRRDTTDVRP